jgi:glycerol-3-phosphate dehydrogenase
MTDNHHTVDILIIGGGIAGLWLLNTLGNKGYQCLLLEQDSLGCRQTVASQGMIHGGIKYALGGALTGSSESIAAMPERWKQCLRGEGDVDLGRVRVLSDDFYMWPTGSIASRITGFLASKSLRGRVEVVKGTDRPEVLQASEFSGSVYKLYDPVLDTVSLVTELAANHASSIARVDWKQSRFLTDEQGQVSGVELVDGEKRCRVDARRTVLTAGEGNEVLLESLGIHSEPMQRRPLHQVLVKSPALTPLFAHCIGTNASPRLTISSHPCRDGQWAWYLGGDLATEGTDLDPEAQIGKAKKELDLLLPWVDLSDAQWASYTIDRAEPRQPQLIKPENAYASVPQEQPKVIVAWPTKLSLAPNLAGQVVDLLEKQAVTPGKPDVEAAPDLPKPAIAEPPWELLF